MMPFKFVQDIIYFFQNAGIIVQFIIGLSEQCCKHSFSPLCLIRKAKNVNVRVVLFSAKLDRRRWLVLLPRKHFNDGLSLINWIWKWIHGNSSGNNIGSYIKAEDFSHKLNHMIACNHITDLKAHHSNFLQWYALITP